MTTADFLATMAMPMDREALRRLAAALEAATTSERAADEDAFVFARAESGFTITCVVAAGQVLNALCFFTASEAEARAAARALVELADAKRTLAEQAAGDVLARLRLQ